MIWRRNWAGLTVIATLVAAAACQSNDDGTALSGASGASAGGASQTNSGAAGVSHIPSAGSTAGDGAAAGADSEAEAGSNAQPARGGNAGASEGGKSSAGEGGLVAVAGAAEAGAAGEAGSAGQGLPSAPAEVAYLGTVLSGMFTCAVDPLTGVPTLLGAVTSPQTAVAALAVDGKQRHLYVAAEQNHLDVYPIAADGRVPAEPSSSVVTPDMLNTLTLDPLGRFAYAGSVFGGAIYAFEIDPDSGALTSLGDPIVVGDGTIGANYVVIDPTGRFLYLSNGFAFGITGYTIERATGALKPIPGSPFGATGIPGDHNVFAGAIAIEPRGRFLYSVGGALNGFAIAADGTLTLLSGSPFTLDVQSDPDATNLAIDPQGAYLYATHFFGNNHIHGFKIDASDGSLTAVPNSPFTGSTPYSVAVDPSGRFLYVGVDESNGLDAYTIARSDGALKRVAGAPFGIGGLEPALTFATLAAH